MDSVCIDSYFAFQPLYIKLFGGGRMRERARGGRQERREGGGERGKEREEEGRKEQKVCMSINLF